MTSDEILLFYGSLAIKLGHGALYEENNILLLIKPRQTLSGW